MNRKLWLSLITLLALAACGGEAITEVSPPAVTVSAPTPAPVASPGATVTRRPITPWPTASPTAPQVIPSGTPEPPPEPSPDLSPTTTPPVPAPSAAPPPTCNRPPDRVPQLIVPGDTVGRLAACAGASVAEVAAANCLTGAYTIYAGQSLWLPRACAPPATATTGSEEGGQNVTSVERPSPPPPGPGLISIGPASATPGQRVTLALREFDAGSVVTLTFEDADLELCATRTVLVDGRGTADYALFVPGNFPSGFISVTAEDPNNRLKRATGGFSVTGSDAPGCGAPLPSEAMSPTPTATTEPTATTGPTATTEPTLPATATPTLEATPTPTTEATPTP